MSYFYQHIKGLTSQSTKWKINGEAIDNSSGMITPQILFTKLNQSEVSLGNIITSNMTNGIINNDFSFNRKTLNTKQIIFGNNTTSFFNNNEVSNSNNYIWYDESTEKLKLYANTAFEAKSNNNVLALDGSKFAVNGDSSSVISFVTSNTTPSNVLTQCPISFSISTGGTEKGFAITSLVLEAETALPAVWFNIPIQCERSVHALYFNATSDRRAKTDIIQSTFSALDIINKLPIYNFKYKSDNTDSIGIIAQEALKVNAGEFGLVVNPQASGENGDYMSVKESKLVYITWKAIQEQQKIIDNQSKEIEELKQLVKTLIQK